METERKYLRPPLDEVRRRLLALGASTEGPHFESNVVLDDGCLISTGKLLRLRTQEFPHSRRYKLTFKYKTSNTLELERQGIKAREELEVDIGAGPILERIFQQLGYLPVYKYEKVREEWHLTYEGRRCAVALDTLPFGLVAEIEGPVDMLDRLGQELGLDKCEISPKSYYELQREFSQSSAPEILFSLADREAMRAALHLRDQNHEHSHE